MKEAAAASLDRSEHNGGVRVKKQVDKWFRSCLRESE